MTIAERLVAGSDVWLNNPIRPQEASGTSGMKAVLNGCLTFSISDGWWDEFADDRYGWTIPNAVGGDPRERDRMESDSLYEILEHSIAPMFYDRDERDVPQRWLGKVRESMSVVGPQIAAERMVRDYVTELYLPAGRAAAAVADPAAPRAYAEWQERVTAAWPAVAVTNVGVDTSAPVAGGAVRIGATVDLGRLEAADVRVEAVVGRRGEQGDIVDPRSVEMSADASDAGRYAVEVPVDRPGELSYTVRVVPRHELLKSPAELGLVRLPR